MSEGRVLRSLCQKEEDGGHCVRRKRTGATVSEGRGLGPLCQKEEDWGHCVRGKRTGATVQKRTTSLHQGKRIEVTVSEGRGLGSLCKREPRHCTKERELKSLCQREEDLLHCAKEDHVTAPRREN